MMRLRLTRQIHRKEVQHWTVRGMRRTNGGITEALLSAAMIIHIPRTKKQWQSDDIFGVTVTFLWGYRYFSWPGGNDLDLRPRSQLERTKRSSWPFLPRWWCGRQGYNVAQAVPLQGIGLARRRPPWASLRAAAVPCGRAGELGRPELHRQGKT